MEETRRESSTAAGQPRREGNQLVWCCGAAADGRQHQRPGTNEVEPLQGRGARDETSCDDWVNQITHNVS